MSEQTKSPYEATRERYVEILEPLFLPDDPVSHDIVNYFASLLRVFGAEDCGWDPYGESRATLEDLNSFFELSLPADLFPDPNATHWRIGLLLYSHVVEMDAPYEVLTNLLRFRLNKGYYPGAFFDVPKEKKGKSFKQRDITTGKKIEIIKELSTEAGLPNVGNMFNDFYNSQLRNAVAHADYILADSDFRCRGNINGTKAFQIPYWKLDEMLSATKAFITAFLQVEHTARQVWGRERQKGVPYDPCYKGLMEILVDEQNAMCGFRVHWPNGSESTYRRTEDGIEMINCYFDFDGATIAFVVGEYARSPGTFSPLVERDSAPSYSKLDRCDTVPSWPTSA